MGGSRGVFRWSGRRRTPAVTQVPAASAESDESESRVAVDRNAHDSAATAKVAEPAWPDEGPDEEGPAQQVVGEPVIAGESPDAENPADADPLQTEAQVTGVGEQNAVDEADAASDAEAVADDGRGTEHTVAHPSESDQDTARGDAESKRAASVDAEQSGYAREEGAAPAESDASDGAEEAEPVEVVMAQEAAGRPEGAKPAEAAHGAAGPTPQQPDTGPTPVREETDDLGEVAWVRPYVWTGGKTTSPPTFAMETLVSAKAAGPAEAVKDEHRRVLELCAQPRSVSEVAAMLSVPLGVAKTLLASMVEENLITVHPAGSGAEGPDLELMQRVLRGLRDL